MLKKIVFIVLIFSGFSVFAQVPKISESVIGHLKSHPKVPVLIYLSEKANFSSWSNAWTKEQKTEYVYTQLKQTADRSQSFLLKELKDRQIDFHSHFLINAITANVSYDDLKWIATFTEVKSIHFDEPLSLNPKIDLNIQNTLSARGPVVTWGIQSIEANTVWDLGFRGKGVTVAGEDTGYKWDVSAIKEKYRGWNGTAVDHNYNWHDGIHKTSPLSPDTINPCGVNLKEPCDDNGHGTHTVGTMVGGTEERAIGVAPDAKWIGCRNMERGNGAPSTYIECFEFFLAPTDLNGLNPKPELAPHVINNSWYCSREEGCDESNFHFMDEAIQNLKKAGVVVVVSAGNFGNSCGTVANPPAIFESSFSVGSYAANDTISGFSSCGPVLVDKSNRMKPNVVAPGSDVLSQVPDGSFQGWYGTSMAGPHVAGLVALIISAYPALAGQVEKIEDIIEATARPAASSLECSGFDPQTIPNIMYGYGKINALSAVKKAIQVKNLDIINKTETVLFPNPGGNELNVRTELGNHSIELYNALGIQLGQYKISNGLLKINTQSLPSGMYWIRIDNQKRVKSWVKE